MNFRTECDHERCKVLAELAQKNFEAMRDDPQLQRLIELDDEIADVHDAVFAVIEHMATGLVAATMEESLVRNWQHEHRN